MSILNNQYNNGKDHEYIYEPINKVIDEIDSSEKDKIILYGGRGIGKSVVLDSLNLKQKDLLLVRFDSVGLNRQLNNFDEEFYSSYYETLLSLQLLQYLQKNCDQLTIDGTDEQDLNKYKTLITNAILDIDNFIEKSLYDDNIKLANAYKTKTLSSEILAKLKKLLELEKFSIALDRFDWINSNNEIVQNILVKYFDMFDRVIITSDDLELNEDTRQKELADKGYSLLNINYGNDVNFIKLFIRNILSKRNQNIKNMIFYPEDIREFVYQDLISETNGNLSLVYDITNHAYDTYQWEKGACVIGKLFLEGTKTKKEEQKRLTKMIKKPKLYI